MNKTTGRITRAKSENDSPNPVAPPTRPNATIAPERVVRNIPARLNDSFHASERDASRLQCSVDRICRRIAGEAPAVGSASPARGAGAGSFPMPAVRSNIIAANSLEDSVRYYGAARMDDPGVGRVLVPAGECWWLDGGDRGGVRMATCPLW